MLNNKRKYLFFLVHPAKYHFHKHQILALRQRGHDVEVLIVKKDVLEQLCIEDGVEYTNIFPEGRKIRHLNVYVAAVFSAVRTVIRLLRYTRGKNYDVFVGDLLTVVGLIRGVPSIYPTDNPITQVPEQRVFFSTCTNIVAPTLTYLGSYDKKAIRYHGIKALAHLHPDVFTPDKGRLSASYRGSPFIIIRCVGLEATHDQDILGIDDKVLTRLVEEVGNEYQILISSERELPGRLSNYQVPIAKSDLVHYLAFAELLIADSTTMCAEAAVLGTPAIEYDQYHPKIDQMHILEKEYGLLTCIAPPDSDKLLESVSEHLGDEYIRARYQERRKALLSDFTDVNSFMVDLLERYRLTI